MTPVCLEEAAKGDKIARDILDHNIGELVTTAESVVRRLDLTSSPEESVMVLVGGLMQKESLFGQVFEKEINARLPKIKIQRPLMEPAMGAALYSMKNCK